jgi:predicted cupin superfamily sugar epimerase
MTAVPAPPDPDERVVSTPHHLIKTLGLEPLPAEGGFFRETYRASEYVSAEALPERYGSSRSLATAIYYLITSDGPSRLHRLATDETYHFYLGDHVLMLLLRADGSSDVVTLGPDLAHGHRPQIHVPGGVWQGCMVHARGSYALMGTTMAPGFEYADRELADRDLLMAQYPDRRDLILKLT